MPELAELPPAAASARAYLRGGLPQIYRDDDFAMRFLGGLETVLDPIVVQLDALSQHFAADVGPLELVRLVGVWLGLDVDASLHADPARNERIQRELTDRARELLRARGTRAGLEKLLRVAFPDLMITVEDSGGTTESAEPREAPDAPEPAFTVITEATEIPRELESVLRRMIRRNVPVEVRGRLRVGAAGEEVPV